MCYLSDPESQFLNHQVLLDYNTIRLFRQLVA